MASLARFGATRILSGGLGFASVLLLARWMPVREFAAYSVLMAAVMVSAIAGSLGADRVLYREIPLAHLAHARRSVVRLLRVALLARLAVAPLAAAVIVVVTAPEQPVVPAALSLAFAVAMAVTLSLTDVVAIGANALMRFEAQARLNVGLLACRIAAFAALYHVGGELTVNEVVVITLLTDVTNAALSWWRCISRPLRPGGAAPAGQEYVDLDARTLGRRAMTNYTSYLLGLPWQGSTATLVVGAILPPGQVATFALLQGLLDRARQYLPLQLLQNAFEPLLMRRHARDGDTRHVVRTLELLRRANFVILIGLAAVCLVVGSELIGLMTKGKYPAAGPLAAFMLAALALRGVSGALFVGANVLGEMERLTRSYAAVTLVALPLLPLCASHFGAAGVVAVSIAPSVGLWGLLRLRGALCAVGAWRWRKDALAVLAAALALAAGWGLLRLVPTVAGVLAAAALVAAGYAAMATWMKVFDRRELDSLQRGLRGEG